MEFTLHYSFTFIVTSKILLSQGYPKLIQTLLPQ